MKKAGLGFVLLSCSLAGCVAERMCPSGEMLEGDACVTADGGVTGEDAPASCEVPCGGDTPHCVGGACVACRDDADCTGSFCAEGACVACREDTHCDASAPICDTGECVSCEGQDCTADQIADELAALVCLSAAAAVRSNGDDAGAQRIEEDAVAAMLCGYPGFFDTLLYQPIRDGRTTLDFAAVRECLDAAQNVGGGLVLFALTECENALTGTAADGATCASHFDCASGYCEAGAACSGVCAPQVAVGMPCDDDEECSGDASCLSSVCRAPTPDTGAGLGEACDSDFDCGGDLVCREGDTCGAIPGDGMPCNTDGFFTTVCEFGTYCDGTTCRTRIAAGEPCSDDVSCAAGTRCAGTPARCLPVVGTGMACDDDVVCGAGTNCDDGSCSVWPTLGESCTSECYRGTCVSGTCTSATVGAACPAGVRYLDALDPCGEGSTCRRDGDVWTCAPTVGLGSSCLDAICDEPTSFCSDEACRAPCAL